jgi:hypothetical protein
VIYARVSGVIPPQALVEFDGAAPWRELCNIVPDKDERFGRLYVRRDGIERSVRFQITANDAVTDWTEVRVVPPPELVPLAGRPSPQVRLQYPAYTDLAPEDLPDGSGNIEAVRGTHVSLRAAVDRPIRSAWIEYQPEQTAFRPAIFAGCAGASHPLGFCALFISACQVGGRTPVEVNADGRTLAADFLPQVRGTYSLGFEDSQGAIGNRLFDLHLFNDPPPSVHLERPSRSLDRFEVLPGGEIPVRILVEDPQYGIRSIHLQYRVLPESARRLTLYDMQANSPRATIAAAPTHGGLPAYSLIPKPTRLQVTKQLDLHEIRHANGNGVREGDVIVLQALADDFDDVTTDKGPGRSHEVELVVIGPAAVDTILSESQGRVQRELVELNKLQQNALRDVSEAQQQALQTTPRREEVDGLLHAEQLQERIAARLGTPQEGLRSEVNRTLETIQNNHLQVPGTQERMRVIASELARIAEQELRQVQPLLARARQEQERASQSRQQSRSQPGSLALARERQQEIANTFGELLRLLEPWGNMSQVQEEARHLLQEQRRLYSEIQALQTTRGRNRDDLNGEQQAALDSAGDRQQKLGDRAAELLDKLDRLTRDGNNQDADTADTLREAAAQGRKEDAATRMREAGQAIHSNRLDEAQELQRQAAQTLEHVTETLMGQQERDLERLRKKIQETKRRLDQLSKRQDELRKKIKDADPIANREARSKELQELQRQQEAIKIEAQILARQLTLLGGHQAAEELRNAARRMESAANQLARAEPATGETDAALEDLHEARQALRRVAQEMEEQLSREKLGKTFDELKRLHERQAAATAEWNRLHQQALRKIGWNRVLQASLTDLADSQQELAKDTESLAQGKLSGTPVFVHVLAGASQAMHEAANRMLSHREQTKDHPDQVVEDRETTQQQQQSLRYLDQLLTALKRDQELPTGRGAAEGQDTRGPVTGENGISELAQLAVLRSLQEAVNEHTTALRARHKGMKKLNDSQQREIESLRHEQRHIAELLDQLTSPRHTEGDVK